MKRAAQDIRIIPLAEVPDQVPVLARLFIEEWEPYYGPGGPGDAEADLASCCGQHRVPTAIVALDTHGNLLGTAALKAESVGSAPGYGPWLAAFLVAKEHRRRGIGTALVAAIEDLARFYGYPSLYISTDATAEGIVSKRGWQALNQVSSLRGPITVYRRDLKSD